MVLLVALQIELPNIPRLDSLLICHHWILQDIFMVVEVTGTQMIRKYKWYLLSWTIATISFQVYLVVAGLSGSSVTSSTEILVSGSNSWVTISPLPIIVFGLKTVNYENTILAFGKLSLTFIKRLLFSYCCRRIWWII